PSLGGRAHFVRARRLHAVLARRDVQIEFADAGRQAFEAFADEEDVAGLADPALKLAAGVLGRLDLAAESRGDAYAAGPDDVAARLFGEQIDLPFRGDDDRRSAVDLEIGGQPLSLVGVLARVHDDLDLGARRPDGAHGSHVGEVQFRFAEVIGLR